MIQDINLKASGFLKILYRAKSSVDENDYGVPMFAIDGTKLETSEDKDGNQAQCSVEVVVDWEMGLFWLEAELFFLWDVTLNKDIAEMSDDERHKVVAECVVKCKQPLNDHFMELLRSTSTPPLKDIDIWA